MLWHPDVHRAYAEQLFFFLIRSRFFSADYKRSLEEQLRDRAPGGWAVFETLGYYDLLVRVWLTYSSYADFTKRIQESPQTLRLQEFRCGATGCVRYLWSSEFRRRPALQPGEILALEQGTLESAQNDPQSEKFRTKLEQAGLILPDGLDRSQPGRFYCLVTFPGDREFEITRAVEDDLYGLAEARGIAALSLYSGVGVANVLIKGRASGFEVLHDFPLGLRALQSFGPRIRTETIVAGRPSQVEEWDHINFAAAKLSSELQLSYGQFVGLPLPTSGEPSAHEILRSFESVVAVFPHDTEGYLRRVFRGWLKRSVVDLKSGALPILEIEGLLSEYFRRWMQDAYESDWVKVGLRTVATRGGLKETAKAFGKFTFDDLVCCLAALNKEQALEVEQELGAQWESELRAIEKIRNRCAHSLDAESANPENLVTDLRTALPMYYKLRTALQRLRERQ